METSAHRLWIGADWVPSVAGTWFEPRARSAPFLVRGQWPRAGEADLWAALGAAAAAGPAWSATARGARLAICELALERLEARAASGDLAALLAPALGIASEVALELLCLELLEAREALELARDGGLEDCGAGLFAAHWSDRIGRLFARLVGRLAAGSRLVLVGDRALPEGAEVVAQALCEAGLPPGVLGLLFDDGRTLLRAARACPDLAFVRECAHTPEPAAPGGTSTAFGAGLTRWTTRELASGVHVVARSADPVREAGLLLDLALGPCRTLYGQLPDSIGVVLCPSRVFAALSAELLVGLEARPDWGAPHAPLEPDLADWLDEAWNLGLDEGAAPIFGEPPEQLPPLHDPSPDRERRRAPRAIQALLFTNVDPHGRLIALARPGPLLRLVRMDSEAEARALAQRLQERRSRLPSVPLP